MSVLIDTSFLLASVFLKDVNHALVKQTIHDLKGSRLIPAPVVYEVFYMVTVRVSYRRAVQLLQLLRSASFEIIPLTSEDYQRIESIAEFYLDTEFDFTDMAIMALSERLNISQIYTFDRRDFSIFRPRHYPVLDLKP